MTPAQRLKAQTKHMLASQTSKVIRWTCAVLIGICADVDTVHMTKPNAQIQMALPVDVKQPTQKGR